MKTNSILLCGVGLVMVSLAGIALIDGDKQSAATQKVNHGSSSSLRPDERGSVSQADNRTPNALQAALAESDPERRRQLLKQWADSIETGNIESLLEQVNSTVNQELRSEVRQVLLSSWVGRDMPGMAAWFGERPAADEMHQESRDTLLKALATQEPSKGLSWMEKTLPESVRRELYGPFFRQWTSHDPAAAAAKLRQMLAASPQDAILGDLFGQLAGQWARADLNRALGWAMSLPEGTAKSEALVQMSYRWAEVDPRSAAAYASQQKDVALLNAVASTWAASDPKSAVVWALGLPSGERQNNAIAGAAVVWAQKDPAAAAVYANSLPAGEARNQARIAIASMWANNDAPKAAKWVEQFTEGAAREQAFEQVINAWAVSDVAEAGRWLQSLPENRSRDSAVIAFCNVIDGTDPDVSFEWTETLADESIRNQRLLRTAAFWLKENPAEARQHIAQSNLPAEFKKQLLAGASPGGS